MMGRDDRSEGCGEQCPMAGASLGARLLFALALALAVLVLTTWGARADERFKSFLSGLWPEAQANGVSRATFDAAFKGLEPDLKLPDLILPGRSAETGSQAEFSRPPADYLNKTTLARLATEGRGLLVRHAAALDAIERKLGVDRYTVLAIWGRETAFGQHRLPHDAIRVLATQAYLGRRKDMFRQELLYALKMLESGIARADMRSSWAGAMGLTQFMPSEFVSHAQDIDGDGKIDLFRSVADALGSAARQLKDKGWVPGQPWGFEVRLPATATCALEGPAGARALAEWVKLGFARVSGGAFPQKLMASEAYLMMPAGAYGPAFLVLENYRVIRRYNTSDLYATFVGNLADRIAGGGDFATPWSPLGPQKAQIVEGVQRHLQGAGYEIDKIDGKIGSNTRRMIGAYQTAQRISVDCWPTPALLTHMERAATR